MRKFYGPDFFNPSGAYENEKYLHLKAQGADFHNNLQKSLISALDVLQCSVTDTWYPAW